jgi:Fe-S-cluster containining protein
MFKLQQIVADVENTATWIRYKRKLCDSCSAVCCTLPVEVTGADLARMELADSYELEDNQKKIARALEKKGVIEHFHVRSGVFTLARRADGSCVFLDPKTRRCTIYSKRPNTCRNHPQVGPRSGYCAYQPKEAA